MEGEDWLKAIEM
jgi:hypothetical protein